MGPTQIGQVLTGKRRSGPSVLDRIQSAQTVELARRIEREALASMNDVSSGTKSKWRRAVLAKER